MSFDWDERFEVHEDESGKWNWPVWHVIDSLTNEEVAGPFSSEDQAIQAAGALALDVVSGIP